MTHHISLMGRFTDAVAYAATAHGHQVRKGTDIPYLSHLLAVTAMVLEYGGDETQATAAVLHDVVEDCGGARRLEDVRMTFGDDIATLVHALSDASPADGEAKPPWKDRKERYLDDLEELTADGHPATLVSLCDKLHNARAIVADAADPEGPGPKVWERFSASPADVAWYYRELARCFHAGRLPTRAVAAFDRAVDQLQQHARLADADEQSPAPADA